MDIHTQQLRHFMELAKCLNFTKAAMNLYIAQPALSQQIAELEKQLGVTLFVRTSRSVSLTPAGDILKKACPEILNTINGVQKQLLSAQAGLLGNLTIGYLGSFHAVLPMIVQEYRDIYPDVEVNLFLGNAKELQDALRNQNADIVFTSILQDSTIEDTVFAQRTIWQEGLSLVLRKDHPFVLSGGHDYSLLRNNTFCLLDDENSPGFRHLVQRVCQDIGLPIMEVTTTPTWSPIAIQIEAGMAISILPSRISDLICSYQEQLVAIPIQENCMTYDIVWNPNSKNAALPLFLDVLETTLDGITADHAPLGD